MNVSLGSSFCEEVYVASLAILAGYATGYGDDVIGNVDSGQKHGLKTMCVAFLCTPLLPSFTRLSRKIRLVRADEIE